MDRFLPQTDELARLIDAQAVELYHKMQALDVNALGMPYHCLAYFNGSHSKRLFFSIETSAHLLYRAIGTTGRRPKDLVIMDYGAGVGTLYMLAKMIGCKQVIYNDHLDDWRHSAQLIANALGVEIDVYIVGDIEECLANLQQLQINCDIVTSRNVIEHIYKLDVFYNSIYKSQPSAIIVSSTTANKKNPASVLKHMSWHKKWEKVYRGKREVTISRQSPGISAVKLKALGRATQGLALDDLKQAIEEYRRTGSIPDPSKYGTNTNDPANGVWAEHLISTTEYRRLINESHYQVSFAPGFWDTHYQKSIMSFAGRLLNKLILSGGDKAMIVAPFIYINAIPVKR